MTDIGTILPLPTPGCDHPQRYTAIGGWTLCEPCAREASGWGKCRWCKTVTDQKVCDACLADTASVLCPTCDGFGYYDCDEHDCHGEYCEDGEIMCADCQGFGAVSVPVAEALGYPKVYKIRTVNTGDRT